MNDEVEGMLPGTVQLEDEQVYRRTDFIDSLCFRDGFFDSLNEILVRDLDPDVAPKRSSFERDFTPTTTSGRDAMTSRSGYSTLVLFTLIDVGALVM